MKLPWAEVLPYIKDNNLKVTEIIRCKGKTRINVVETKKKGRPRTIVTDPSLAHSHEYPLP